MCWTFVKIHAENMSKQATAVCSKKMFVDSIHHFFFVSCFWLLGFCVLLFQFIYSIQIDQLLILFCSAWMFKICLNAYTCCCLHEIIAQPLFIHRKYGERKVPSCCLRQVTTTIFWGPIRFLLNIAQTSFFWSSAWLYRIFHCCQVIRKLPLNFSYLS